MFQGSAPDYLNRPAAREHIGLKANIPGGTNSWNDLWQGQVEDPISYRSDRIAHGEMDLIQKELFSFEPTDQNEFLAPDTDTVSEVDQEGSRLYPPPMRSVIPIVDEGSSEQTPAAKVEPS